MAQGRLVAAIVIAVLGAITPYATASDEVIEMCDFSVPRALVTGNATFLVALSAVVDQEGALTQIAAVRNEFLADRPFVDCLRQWRLAPGVGTVTVLFQWQHGQGWSSVTVSGEGFRRVVRFNPGWHSTQESAR